jgi:peroxidase
MNLDGFVRGMAEEEAMAWDENFISDVTDHLFQADEAEGGLDLVALNIQRGRDHGLPGNHNLANK